MDYNRITKLLERYFTGETTIAEERELRSYFAGETVAREHLPYRDLFRFYAGAREAEYPGNVRPSTSGGRQIRIRPVFWRAAAAVAIVLGTWWLYPTTSHQPTAIDWSKYEPASPEEAFRLTSQALRMASDKLNTGAQQAAQEVSKVKKVF